MHSTESKKEKFILVAVDTDNIEINVERSLEELEELVKTSGGEVCGKIIQKRDVVHRGLYVGSGKVDEIRDHISLYEADGIVCDDELSNTQIRNLAQELDVKVLDRTLLILDIFANRALSAEGKAQVLLAQLRYRLSHLSGIGKSLSRLGAGIGTRGPGETKLETDRRHIRNQIDELTRELKQIESHRKLLRENRKKNSSIVVSLVGYTNAGKSTIMNTFTGSDVYADNKLFATLDTTARKLSLKNQSEVILTDTVGFIHKLPTTLIKAFRATLEELKYADIIIHVVDAASPYRDTHMKVVYDTLGDLNITDKPIITVFNKMDLEVEFPLPKDKMATKEVLLSAIENKGHEEFIDSILNILKEMRKPVKLLIPYTEGSLLNLIRERSEILEETYENDGTLIVAYVDEEIYNRSEKFMIL
ncbi:MAG: GTPase HflX [Defluviitaleaceae bacterium]|nr:GTPase HflX [Defluviitaleaceae bacterium]